jgi:ribosomal-protein-alanine N-acetyltransferase
MPLPETPRLFLREFTSEDAPFLLELLNSPGWLQYIGDRNIHTAEEASKYITGRLIPSYTQYGFGFYLVTRKYDEEKIGMCGLVKRASLEDVDIGYAFLPDYTGKGYALEATQAILNYGRRDLKLEKIVAITNIDNVRSIRLLEKVGMKCEKKMTLPGETVELFLYVV